ncbi:hypothetical protein LMG28614_03253 [Paraburkholderia ultramafica]|uniref:Uncharacterized protein n=2 Tax=Paraburkholderia ultramafica TaxID=1544867 RepID=A0A6S7B835_9BURK|nr:hypothetical protein [Paraburkholderia ultramafica]CAB3791219.1 hypothetical protein LMG28614_03253 [Paraburkholderia ultramafica]
MLSHHGRLRRLLSAHEFAALLLLSSAPVELTSGTADYLELVDAGLVQIIDTQFALTDEGSMVLTRLAAL